MNCPSDQGAKVNPFLNELSETHTCFHALLRVASLQYPCASDREPEEVKTVYISVAGLADCVKSLTAARGMSSQAAFSGVYYGPFFVHLRELLELLLPVVFARS